MAFFCPPLLRIWKLVVETGGVMATGQGMEEENCIVFSDVELAVGFVYKVNAG